MSSIVDSYEIKKFFTKKGDGFLDKKRNVIYKKIKDDDNDRIEIEIGDSKQKPWQPQFKFMKWDNEVNFSIRYTGKGKFHKESEDDKETFAFAKEKARLYEHNPYNDEDGGFEFDLVLDEQPKSNKIEFSIKHKGLNFFHQDKLTKEEIDQGFFRPEHVINSYAIYHKTKKNNIAGGKHYKTGKVFHIYRPKIFSADGNWVWGKLNIDEENNILSVTIPDDFYNNALYPILVDPTFGYTSVGSGTHSWNVNQIRGTNASQNPGENGTVDSISFYARIANMTVRGGLYIGSDESFLAGTGEGTGNSANEWVVLDYSSPPSVSDQGYRVALFAGTSTFQIAADSLANAGFYDLNGTYPTWEDPLNPTVYGWKYSIYATYTAEGGEEYTKDLSETLTLVDSALKTTNRALLETISLVDSIIRTTGRTLIDVVTLVDSIITSKTLVRTYTDTIALVDTILKTTSRTISEAVTLVDNFISARTLSRTYTEIVTLVDSISKATGKTLFEAITLVDFFIKQIGKTLTESITLVDSIITESAFYRTLTESVALVDSVLKTASKTLADSVILVDVKEISKVTAKTLTDAITLVDSVFKNIGRTISESVTLVDSYISIASLYKTMTESITLVDSILKTIGRTLTDPVALSDSITRVSSRTFSEVVTLIDSFTKTMSKTLTNSITLVDNLTKLIVKNLTEEINLSDVFSKVTSKIMSEIITLVDTVTTSQAAEYFKTITNSLNLSDILVKGPQKVLTESIIITDRFLKYIKWYRGVVRTWYNRVTKNWKTKLSNSWFDRMG